jgi:ATP-dependent protease HslVU (ClpYQ) ATPase subunit
MKNFNAIRFLYPDAIFSMINDDVSMITWVGEEYPSPTAKQLSDAIKAIEDKEAQDLLDKEEAKNSALAKLQALGLTEAEAKAIAGV